MLESIAVVVQWVLWLLAIVGVPMAVGRMFVSMVSSGQARRLMFISPEQARERVRSLAPAVKACARGLSEFSRVLVIAGGLVMVSEREWLWQVYLAAGMAFCVSCAGAHLSLLARTK